LLSSRKVYKSKPNIKENSKLLPKSSYSRNKLITEKKLLKKFKKNLIILRISNIIGNKSNKKNHLHRTFVDIFFDNAKKGFVFENKKQFKDFISIDKFCQIIVEIIKKNLSGIYNVSIGEKIKINSIVAWLNFYNPKKCKILSTKKNIIKQNFYLNNKKLMSKIKTKNTKNDLKKYCLKLSKKKFA
jgi:Nucleoside-diphosphate-sugar epimerases